MCGQEEAMAGAPKPKSRPYTWQDAAGEAFTLATGALGAALFIWLHVPGGSMSGSVVAVTLLAVFGKATSLGRPLQVLGLGSIGVAIGSVVGPDTFDNVASYPATMALMAVCVLCMTLASAAVWRYIMGWPASMAVLASVPGSMGYIVSVSMSMGADAAKVAVVQMSRVIFLVTILPWIIVWEQGSPGVLPQQVYDSPLTVAWVLGCGIAAGLLFLRFSIPGGIILGAMIFSGSVHFAGLAPGRAPTWLMDVGQIVLGAWVGSRFVDFDWSLFLRILMGALLAIGAALAVSISFAWVASQYLGVSFGAALIGYSPGGQEAMVALALVLAVDPIFVATHHLGRYFLINITLPFIVAWMRRAEGKQ
jgi:membrane AbrB-like protein